MVDSLLWVFAVDIGLAKCKADHLPINLLQHEVSIVEDIDHHLDFGTVGLELHDIGQIMPSTP